LVYFLVPFTTRARRSLHAARAYALRWFSALRRACRGGISRTWVCSYVRIMRARACGFFRSVRSTRILFGLCRVSCTVARQALRRVAPSSVWTPVVGFAYWCRTVAGYLAVWVYHRFTRFARADTRRTALRVTRDAAPRAYAPRLRISLLAASPPLFAHFAYPPAACCHKRVCATLRAPARVRAPPA